MTTRLDIYNGALMLAGERFLASLDEEREPRRLLDQVWNNGGVRALLEAGQWHFAMRGTRLDYDPGYTREWGYAYAFQKPTDWVQTSGICSDEFFRTPLINYQDEAGYWFADITPIYVRIVSDDASYGNNLAAWPISFVDYAKAKHAADILPKLAGDKAKQIELVLGPPGQPERGLLHQRLHMAKNAAALGQPTQIPAQGSWSSARRGNRAGNNDRGGRGSLIG